MLRPLGRALALALVLTPLVAAAREPAPNGGGATRATNETLRSTLLGPAIELLRAHQDDLLGAMAERAVKKGLRDTDDVREYLGYVPLCALLFVPLWLWRRHAWQRARARGVSLGRVVWRSVVATILVTLLLEGFIQVFLVTEEFKRLFSWTTPAQALSSNAVLYLVDKGEKTLARHARVGDLVAETIRAVASGQRTPEALVGHLFENARRFQDTWAFRWGYRLYAKVFPLLDYFGPALLFVMFLVFLRFSIPGVKELLSHVSGEGPPGVGFVRSLWRHLRTEIFAMALFLFPYVLVTAISFLVTFIVTSVAAQGIIENTLNALSLSYAGSVDPKLIVANFVGITVFVFEVIVLLLVATTVILAKWMQVIHDKFHTKRSWWSYRRFLPYFVRVTTRLYVTLVVPAILLAAGLDYVGDLSADLGPVATMLMPAGLVVAFNLLLYAFRFFGGLRRAFDDRRWRPEAAPATP